MFSMRSASRVAKVAIAGSMAFFIFGNLDTSVYAPYIGEEGSSSMIYFLLLVGEALIGIIMGFFISIIFAAFSAAGQFLAFQMGLSAASSYDALSQVENPLMGQFFNLVAMLVFMQTHWFQKLFLQGLVTSFSSLNALSIATANEKLAMFMVKGLSSLFSDALVIALPVMGTLFLITVSTGLLTKAAPQMNLLSEGFPIMILVAFTIIAFAMPSIIDFFVRSFNKGFADLENLFLSISGGV
jgi:flagellar biosynthetic protein FliR